MNRAVGIERGRVKSSRNATLDVFDRFDCIEPTQVATKAACFRWSTGPVRRDDLFLSLLGLRPNQ